MLIVAMDLHCIQLKQPRLLNCLELVSTLIPRSVITLNKCVINSKKKSFCTSFNRLSFSEKRPSIRIVN